MESKAVTTEPLIAARQGGSLSRKLFRSHMAVGLIGVVMLLVALANTLWVQSYTIDLAHTQAPAALASVRLLKGLERSHAALRGWVVTGDFGFRESRKAAWNDEIFPTLVALQDCQAQGATLGAEKSLAGLPGLLHDLHELQWWIEDVAQTPGNEPAKELFYRTVDPVAHRVQAGITALIDMEKNREESVQGREMLGAMADLRGMFLASWHALEDFRALGLDSDEKEFREAWKTVSENLSWLLKNEGKLAGVQAELLPDLQDNLGDYRAAAEDVMAARRDARWNVAREMLVSDAVPLGIQIFSILEPLSDRQIAMMQDDAERVEFLGHTTIGISIGLVGFSLLVASLVSRRSAVRITRPIQKLSEATQQMVCATWHHDLPIESDDELGRLTDSFNSMGRSLQESALELRSQKFALDSHSIVAITDSNGRITYANERFCQISKYSFRELIGQDHRILNSGHHPKSYMKNIWDTICRGEVWKGEIKNRAKDGSFYWVDTTIVPFKNEAGVTIQYVAIRTDITKRKEADVALLASKEAAEAANVAKSEFVANMSHEMRTPLHGILSFAKFGVDEASSAKRDALAEHFENIERSGDRLLELINNLLDLAKLEAGKMAYDFAPGDVGETVCSVMAEFGTMFRDRGITPKLVMPEGVIVATHDAVRIGQVVRNLLSNAIRFSPDAGVIEVSLAEVESTVRLSVRDGGVGVPEGELKSVFDKFVQSSKTKTGAGGTGLGLSICREITVAHEGHIWAENHPEGGAVFIVELPVNRISRGCDRSLDQAETGETTAMSLQGAGI